MGEKNPGVVGKSDGEEVEDIWPLQWPDILVK